MVAGARLSGTAAPSPTAAPVNTSTPLADITVSIASVEWLSIPVCVSSIDGWPPTAGPGAAFSENVAVAPLEVAVNDPHRSAVDLTPATNAAAAAGEPNW